MTYNFAQALQVMSEGKTVISEESGIVYSMDAGGLKSQGNTIDPTSVSTIEANGSWYVITPDKMRNKFRRISPQEKNQMIEEAIKKINWR